ncbi:MAG: hypothetical protein ACYC7D_05730 [Nitrososphaerales archaeon]
MSAFWISFPFKSNERIMSLGRSLEFWIVAMYAIPELAFSVALRTLIFAVGNLTCRFSWISFRAVNYVSMDGKLDAS